MGAIRQFLVYNQVVMHWFQNNKFLFIFFGLLAAFPLYGGEVLLKRIVFQGNSCFSSSELQRVTGLRPGRSYSFQALQAGAKRVLLFYRERGIAYVEMESAHVDLEGAFVMRLEEGRIHEIRILNKNIYTIYKFKKALQIKPQQVFNRFFLRAEMQRLKKKFRLKKLNYISRSADGYPGERNIFIDARGYKARSFSYSLDAEAFYLIPKLGYRNYDFWGLDHEVSLYTRTKLGFLRLYDHVFGVEYFFPSIFGKVIRPFLKGEVQLQDRAREDMNIDYNLHQLQMSISVETRLAEHINIRMGVSHFIYSIHDVSPQDGGLPVSSLAVESGRRHRPGFFMAFELLDPEGRFNRDKAFRLAIGFNGYMNQEKRFFVRLGVQCEKIFERGFDDFVIDGRYWYMSEHGEYFNDLEVTGVSLRGYTPSRLFTRHLFSLNLEYKLSLWKNYVKMIFFMDTVFYRPIAYNGAMRESPFKLLGSFGEGFEVNVSEFSFRLYYGVPYQNNLKDGRFKVQLRKVF